MCTAAIRGDWRFGDPERCLNDNNAVDLRYVNSIIARLKSEPHKYDALRIFHAGFSQGALFAAYVSFCLDADTVGFAQAGSSNAPVKLRVLPTSPPLLACIWCNRDDSHCHPIDGLMINAGHRASLHWSHGGHRVPGQWGEHIVDCLHVMDPARPTAPPTAPSPPADCWRRCSERSGACPAFCGQSGACCRAGYNAELSDCGFGAQGCNGTHCCSWPPSPPRPSRPPPLPRPHPSSPSSQSPPALPPQTPPPSRPPLPEPPPSQPPIPFAPPSRPPSIPQTSPALPPTPASPWLGMRARTASGPADVLGGRISSGKDRELMHNMSSSWGIRFSVVSALTLLAMLGSCALVRATRRIYHQWRCRHSTRCATRGVESGTQHTVPSKNHAAPSRNHAKTRAWLRSLRARRRGSQTADPPPRAPDAKLEEPPAASGRSRCIHEGRRGLSMLRHRKLTRRFGVPLRHATMFWTRANFKRGYAQLAAPEEAEIAVEQHTRSDQP